ncbi:MAG: hypothetical protein HRU38_02695 [Saccharospirillaceae bacterium]|nr:hypothetical protein [Pseudomonadales bacterium]NRB77570.1 hypothetical protein [Saccharospirillaceae bacterium]
MAKTKTNTIKTINIAPEKQSLIKHIDIATWMTSKEISINKAVLYINLQIDAKKIRLKVDQSTLSNTKLSLLNNHIELSDYKKISAISLELETSCKDFKIDSTHMQVEFKPMRRKAA